MTAATISSFWANSSKPFTRSYVFSFLNCTISFMKSGIWARKTSEAPLGISSTKTLHMLASFSLEDFYLCMAQISQSLIFLKNRTAGGQLQDFYPKLLINGCIKGDFGIPVEVFRTFKLFCMV